MKLVDYFEYMHKGGFFMGETKKVLICDTTMRDGHQSLLATRMRTEHMLSVAEKIEKVGYYSLET